MIRLRLLLLFLAVVAGFVITAGAADASLSGDRAKGAAGTVVDTGPGSPVLSPMNPAFLAYRNRTTGQPGAVSSRAGTGIVFSNGSSIRIVPDGEIPSPVDFSYTRGLTEYTAATTDSAYPVVYDLRTLGKVTAVKDQGSAGSCWAFATYGSLESSLLKGETWDFSENNMKNILAGTYAAGFDRSWAGGGNRFMSTAYLTRWSGPVPEAADPYSDSSGYSPAGLHTVRHVQDVQFLPERAAPDQTSHIKNALVTTGAVQASIYYDAAYYNPSAAAFYNPDFPSTNHAITIVGWNDAYSRSNFNTPPPANGAWIVKNSWGTGWGDSGYFYVSYYDRNIGDKCAVFRGEPATIYDRVYSYDPLGWVVSLGFDNSTSAMYANIFTARSAETLDAIGLYDTSAGSFTARIYLDPSGGPVNASGPVAEVSWTDSMPAYRTVKVPPVALRKGQKFSIVVTASTPGYGYPVALEYPLDDYASHARAQAGLGYISETGSAWTDMTTVLPETSICLKGYTTLRTKVGIFRPSTRTFYLNNGTVNKTVFGAATDMPVTGDWNGDGLWDVGVYRNATHRFLLKNGSVLRVINFGQSMDLPVTGDWNGDGLWDVGIFNASAKQFRLKNGTKITTISYGSVTDIPVTGDWNGDGLWDVGVFRNASRTFLLRNGPRNTTMVVFGHPADTPVTGDWNGDGLWDVGVFRPAAHRFLLKSGSAAITTLWGNEGDKPVTGKWS